jgi:carbon monoxide dehydrogenase subunit G
MGRVDPFTVSATIARPREEIYEYLSDIANHAEFTDHYLVDWHLTREDSHGRGAGARFKVKAPLSRFSWADMTLAELQPPFRIIARGRGGKFNRIRMLTTWTLSPGQGNSTKVEYTLDTDSRLLSDRLHDGLIGRRWNKRQAGRALRRLRTILEEDRDRGRRATVAAR